MKHKVPQWSFNDAFSEEEMLGFDARIKRMLSHLIKGVPPSSEAGVVSPLTKGVPSLRIKDKGLRIFPTYTVEHKIDGLKVVLEYEKGLLKTAATPRK